MCPRPKVRRTEVRLILSIIFAGLIPPKVVRQVSTHCYLRLPPFFTLVCGPVIPQMPAEAQREARLAWTGRLLSVLPDSWMCCVADTRILTHTERTHIDGGR